MDFAHKFEAFSLVKNGSIYKLLPFHEKQKNSIETNKDEKTTT